MQLEVGPKVLKVVIVWQLCNRNINEKSKQTAKTEPRRTQLKEIYTLQIKQSVKLSVVWNEKAAITHLLI